MKKITLFLTLLTFTFGFSQTVINFDATNQCPDPQTDPVTPCWIGFMNVSNLPAPSGDGVYQFGGGWGINDLISTFDTVGNSVTLAPNRIGDTDPYWQTDGEMEGEKFMEANLFIQDDGLATSEDFTFTGSVTSNTLLDAPQTISYNGTGSDQGDQDLDVAYTAVAFIKIFNSDFSALLYFVTAPLTSGADFMVSYDGSLMEDPSNHVQYGFQVIGPNINSRTEFDEYYNQIGNIVIEPATLSINDFELSEINVFPNPSNSVWNIKTNNQPLNSVEVFDILGKQVMDLEPNTDEISIDASQLNNGIYLAKITSDNATKTVKLVKN